MALRGFASGRSTVCADLTSQWLSRKEPWTIRHLQRLCTADAAPTFAGVSPQPLSPHNVPPSRASATMSTPPAGAALDQVDDVEEVENGARRGFPLAVVAILSLVAAGGVVDLALDRPQRWISLHVLFELALVSLSLGSIAVLTLRWRRASSQLAGARQALASTRRSLADRQAERDQWRASAQSVLAGLGIAIDRQFSAWGLTPTEREVALLLLKGVGHKQIAARSGRSERTVRQHAVSVYQKAGLGGRAELAAFFLHDLMLPGEDAPSDPGGTP